MEAWCPSGKRAGIGLENSGVEHQPGYCVQGFLGGELDSYSAPPPASSQGVKLNTSALSGKPDEMLEEWEGE